MLGTRVTERFGIEHPVLLGGMGTGTSPALVAAVSEAGGLGILGATGLAPEAIAAAVAEIRDRTSRPFGVNLLLAFASEAQLDACLGAGVPVLSTAWGDPVESTRRALAAGVPVIHMIQTAAQAAGAARAGVAAVVAQGTEGGGHVGSVASIVLIPAVVDAVAGATAPGAAPVPVIAAGGIADGRGLVAALGLGAEAVLLGTRFLATTESPLAPETKMAICRATEEDAIITPIPDLVVRPEWLAVGALCRALRNGVVERWQGRESELAALDAAGRREIATSWAQAGAAGRSDDAPILAGQDCGLIREVLPAAEIVRRVVAEAEAIVRRLPLRLY